MTLLFLKRKDENLRTILAILNIQYVKVKLKYQESRNSLLSP